VKNKPAALIITVNFRHAQCTLQWLESAARLGGFRDCHVTIVDNNSKDCSASRIQQAIAAFSNVELLESSENRGYFGGAKWALENYLAHHSLPDWIAVCNNDIVFDCPNFLTRLFAHDPLTDGVLAPAVISHLTGCDANPMIIKRPGRIRLLRYRLLLSTYYVAWLTQFLAPTVRKLRNRVRPNRPHRATRIYAPHGSFLIFSRAFFENGGFIDDGSFLYAEEFSVAEMCLRLGLPVVHDPTLRVRHNDNQTTGRLLTPCTYSQQKKGLRYAMEEYLNCSNNVPSKAASLPELDSLN